MTIGGFGRITPLQGDMLTLGGLVLGRSGEMDVPDEMRLRAMKGALARLRRHTKANHGYDLAGWHTFLLDHFREEYCHPYAWRTTLSRLETLMEDPDRLRLVEALEAGWRESQPGDEASA